MSHDLASPAIQPTEAVSFNKKGKGKKNTTGHIHQNPAFHTFLPIWNQTCSYIQTNKQASMMEVTSHTSVTSMESSVFKPLYLTLLHCVCRHSSCRAQTLETSSYLSISWYCSDLRKKPRTFSQCVIVMKTFVCEQSHATIPQYEIFFYMHLNVSSGFSSPFKTLMAILSNNCFSSLRLVFLPAFD